MDNTGGRRAYPLHDSKTGILTSRSLFLSNPNTMSSAEEHDLADHIFAFRDGYDYQLSYYDVHPR